MYILTAKNFYTYFGSIRKEKKHYLLQALMHALMLKSFKGNKTFPVYLNLVFIM